MDKTLNCVLCLTVFLGIVNCDTSDAERAEQLSTDLQDVKDLQTSVTTLLAQLDVEITELVNNEKERENPEISDKTQRLALQQSLDDLEEAVAYLEDNLKDEEATDAMLEGLNGKSGEDFIGTITEIQDLALSLRGEIDTVLQPVTIRLEAVKSTTNERNVVLGGVLYYGGIGSSCSAGVDVCLDTDSECRGGKCQCLPGLSSDSLQQRCIAKCGNGYGKTYQTVPDYIIRGFNNIELSNVSLVKCKSRCENEASFVCRSIDYFPHYRSCYLSESVMGDTDQEKDGEEGDNDDDYNYDNNDVSEEEVVGWEYNAAGIHLQRDCKI